MKKGLPMRQWCQLDIISAEITSLLDKLCDRGITLREVSLIDSLSVRVIILKKDYEQVAYICESCGAELSNESSFGLTERSQFLIKRPILIIAVLTLLFLSNFLSERILFRTVEGNTVVSKSEVLEAAEKSGLTFGCKRNTVRSEEIKNGMLRELPELRWVGINTYGCLAVVSVEERRDDSATQEMKGVTSIVASRDGIIGSCTVTSGTQVCGIGQAVKAGQTLVSGYSGSGLFMKGTKASAEIYGITMYALRAVMPLDAAQKGAKVDSETNISLLIGKKRINFNNSSRISGMLCGKMYEEYYVTLPGGFVLPIGFAVEKLHYHEKSISAATSVDEQLLKSLVRQYISKQMLAGKIGYGIESVNTKPDSMWISGQYVCHELIGIEKTEEMVVEYGKDH